MGFLTCRVRKELGKSWEILQFKNEFKLFFKLKIILKFKF